MTTTFTNPVAAHLSTVSDEAIEDFAAGTLDEVLTDALHAAIPTADDSEWESLHEVNNAAKDICAAIGAYQCGEASMGRAAHMSGLLRHDFEALLAARKIERNYSEEDLADDLKWAKEYTSP